MAFLDETGLAEFKAMTDKAYLEKTITPTSVFRGRYDGTEMGEYYDYKSEFPDQDCIPIITDEDFWETPVGSSRWIILTEPLIGSYDYSGFAIINAYDTKTDCESGDRFISYIGDKRIWISVNHGLEDTFENGTYYTYTLQANVPYRITKTSSNQYELYYINSNSNSNNLPSGSEGQFMVYTDGSWQGKTITVGGSY